MVDKKANVKILMNIFFGIILIVVLGIFVFAATFLQSGSVADGGNYSTSIFLNVSTTVNISLANFSQGVAIWNMTCFYNSSGGTANSSTYSGFADAGNLTGAIANQTNSSSPYFNITLDTSFLTDASTYNISCMVTNFSDTGWASNETITIDHTAPAVNFSNTTMSIVNYGNYTSAALGNVSINVSASDAIFSNNYTEVWINLTTSAGAGCTLGGSNFTRAMNRSDEIILGTYYNVTFDVINFPDGNYNFTIYANDSAYLKNALGVVSANLNNTESIQITLDNTAPTAVTLTKANSSRNSLGIDITIADAGSGIGTACTVTGTGTKSVTGASNSQALTVTGLGCSSSYSYVVTCTDRVGYSKASSSYSFMTDSCSNAGTSGPGTTTPVIEKTHSWVTISPGTPALLTDFEEDVGLKQIRVEVRNEVNDVRMIISSHQSNPSTVSIEQFERVYRYLEIETQNLGEELERATIRVQVAKVWVSENDFTIDDIAVFKIDEDGTEWQELVSTYLEEEEDDAYYYYDVEVDSFSYFAIGEKVVEEEEEEEEEPTNLLWLWITLGVVVLVIIIGGGFAAKKRR